MPDSNAVRLAEDDEIRSRLTVAANAIKRELKQREKQQQLKQFVYAPYDTTWIYRLGLEEDRDPLFFTGNHRPGLESMASAWKLSDAGLTQLDEFIFSGPIPKTHSPRFKGVALSDALDLISGASKSLAALP